MKKTITSIIMVIGILCLCACGKAEKSIEDKQNVEEMQVLENVSNDDIKYVDNTAKDIKNTFSIEDKKTIHKATISADFGVNYPNMESLYNKAENVVRGKVTSIVYTDDEAIPRTIYSFEVSESLKGSVEKNSVISVSESNGYVRVKTFIAEYGDDHFKDITKEEIESGVMEQSLGDAPLPKIGDEYVLFLGKKVKEGRVKDAYVILGNFMGKYNYDKTTDSFSRYQPEDDVDLYVSIDEKTGEKVQESDYSLKELKDEIEEIINK